MLSRKNQLIHLTVFAIYCLFWAILFISTGVAKGVHHMDDHEIFAISMDLEKYGFFTTLYKWIITDLNLRYRTGYYIYRIVLVLFFQDNFTAYYVISGAMAVLTSYGLYRLFITNKFSFFLAFLCPFFILVGDQAFIFSHLGPAETPGLLFWVLAMWSMSHAFTVPPSLRSRYEILAAVLITFSSLCKESFTLLLPASGLFYMYLSYVEVKQAFDLKAFLRSVVIPLSYLALLFLFNIGVILFFVGTHTIGYAGVSSEFNASSIYKIILQLFYFEHRFYIFFIVLYLLAFCVFQFGKDELIGLSFYTLFCVGVVLPQIVLYAKSGMVDRYFIPAVVGPTFLMIYIFDQFLRLDHPRLLNYLFILVWGVLSFFDLPKTYDHFKAFGIERANFQLALELVKSNVNNQVGVLQVQESLLSQAELSVFLKRYFDFYKVKHFRVYFVHIPENSKQYLEYVFVEGYGGTTLFLKKIASTDKGFYDEISKTHFAVIMMQQHLEPYFAAQNNYQNLYERKNFGPWVLLIKKKTS